MTCMSSSGGKAGCDWDGDSDVVVRHNANDTSSCSVSWSDSRVQKLAFVDGDEDDISSPISS